MKYQLVVQWPSTSIKDYDAMIEVEGVLIERLSELHEVDGHDAGAGEVNIFIHTNDIGKAFDEVKAALQGENLLAGARIAYREVNKSKYTVLWPDGLKEFNIV